MKRYLALVMLVVAMITMGSVNATLFSTNSTIVNTNTISQPLIMEGCTQGNCTQGHCHNNTNMTEITGILTFDGSKFKIDSIVIYFGSYNYLTTKTSPYDFDGDGTIETLYNEILGLVGSSITVKGYYNCQNTKFNVWYLNGIKIRGIC